MTTCSHLAAAKRGELPSGDLANDYVELALDRLLARGDTMRS